MFLEGDRTSRTQVSLVKETHERWQAALIGYSITLLDGFHHFRFRIAYDLPHLNLFQILKARKDIIFCNFRTRNP